MPSRRNQRKKAVEDDDSDTSLTPGKKVRPVGELVHNEDSVTYDGDDYDQPGWQPGETKKASECTKITDFRMCHLRHTRYETKDGESEVRTVVVCAWCHNTWLYYNSTRLVNHLTKANVKNYPNCEADIPSAAMKEYKAFAEKKTASSTPQRRKLRGTSTPKIAGVHGDEDKNASGDLVDPTGSREKSCREESHKLLDDAIAKFFIVDGKFVPGTVCCFDAFRSLTIFFFPLPNVPLGVACQKAQTPRFGDILRFARNTDDSYKVPLTKELLGDHLSAVYQDHIRSVVALWEDRQKTTGITLCVDATKSDKDSLSLVTAHCAAKIPQVVDVIASGKNKSTKGGADPRFLAERVKRIVHSLQHVNLVVIDGCSDFTPAKQYLETNVPGLFVVEGVSAPLRSMFDSLAHTVECIALSALCVDLYDTLVGQKAHGEVRSLFYSRALLLLPGTTRKSITLLRPSQKKEGNRSSLFFAMHRIVALRAAIRDSLSGPEFKNLTDEEKVISPSSLACLQLDSFYEALEAIVRSLYPALILMEQVLNGQPEMDTLWHHCRHASSAVESTKTKLNELSFFNTPEAEQAGYNRQIDGGTTLATGTAGATKEPDSIKQDPKATGAELQAGKENPGEESALAPTDIAPPPQSNATQNPTAPKPSGQNKNEENDSDDSADRNTTSSKHPDNSNLDPQNLQPQQPTDEPPKGHASDNGRPMLGDVISKEWTTCNARFTSVFAVTGKCVDLVEVHEFWVRFPLVRAI